MLKYHAFLMISHSFIETVWLVLQCISAANKKCYSCFLGMIRSILPNTKLLPRQLLTPPELHERSNVKLLLHVHSFSLHYISESSKALSNSRRTSQRRVEWLTDDFHFIGGVDLPGAVGHVTGVFAAVFRREVLQAESPLLLAALTHLSGR